MKNANLEKQVARAALVNALNTQVPNIWNLKVGEYLGTDQGDFYTRSVYTELNRQWVFEQTTGPDGEPFADGPVHIIKLL